MSIEKYIYEYDEYCFENVSHMHVMHGKNHALSPYISYLKLKKASLFVWYITMESSGPTGVYCTPPSRESADSVHSAAL